MLVKSKTSILKSSVDILVKTRCSSNFERISCSFKKDSYKGYSHFAIRITSLLNLLRNDFNLFSRLIEIPILNKLPISGFLFKFFKIIHLTSRIISYILISMPLLFPFKSFYKQRHSTLLTYLY